MGAGYRASSGIGEEFARQAAASGINVVLLARREERLKEVAAGLTAQYGVEARVAAVDLGRDGILGPVREATGGLDIGLVMSNAGAGNPARSSRCHTSGCGRSSSST